LLAFILENAKEYKVAVPYQGNRHYEPLCGFYSKSVLPEMEHFIQNKNYKLPDLFEVTCINKLIINTELSFFSETLFFNVNSKHELAAAEMLMNNRK